MAFWIYSSIQGIVPINVRGPSSDTFLWEQRSFPTSLAIPVHKGLHLDAKEDFCKDDTLSASKPISFMDTKPPGSCGLIVRSGQETVRLIFLKGILLGTYLLLCIG